MRSIQFRDDINALRAVAVVAVVLFHYKVSVFRGGFVGVDIFFVISGYLMTAIITRRLREDRYSLIGFYGDRARRIVPPLTGLIFGLIVFGFFCIDPITYRKLAASAVSALLFFSNFSFWMEAGYFDAENATKWLLHTWSLSVEWQFYLLYPILVSALWRFAPSRLWLVLLIGAVALASLAASILLSNVYPTSAFYLLPYRAWELLAGGLVALQFDAIAYRGKALAYALLALGLGLILFAIFSFNESLAWPSYWAMIPVLGTCFVIAARQTNLPLFTNPVSRQLGAWSYSIYLWHWPIAVAAYYFGYARTTPLKIACEILILIGVIGIGGAVLMAIQSAWTKRHEGRPPSWRLSATGAFFGVLCAAFAIAANNGLMNRAADGPRLAAAYEANKADFDFPASCDGLDAAGRLQPCRIGDGTAHRILFIGDSQAMQIYARFTPEMAKAHDTTITFLAAHGCPPILGVGETGAGVHCHAFMEKAFAEADTGAYDRIVIISRWIYIRHLPDLDSIFAAFGQRLAALTKRGIAVAIVSATPVPDTDVPQQLLRRAFFGQSLEPIRFEDRPTLEKELAAVTPRLQQLAQTSGAAFYDPMDYLCEAARCPLLDAANDSLFWDQSHYRAGIVKGPRFAFLDEAAGLVAPITEKPQTAPIAANKGPQN